MNRIRAGVDLPATSLPAEYRRSLNEARRARAELLGGSISDLTAAGDDAAVWSVKAKVDGAPYLSAREKGSVLAGLRMLWKNPVPPHVAQIASGGDLFPALSSFEIEALCERLMSPEE